MQHHEDRKKLPKKSVQRILLCLTLSTILFVSIFGIPSSNGYTEYTTHTRITAAAIKMIKDNDPSGIYAELYSPVMLFPDRFHTIHFGKTTDIDPQIPLGGYLSHASALGAICEDEFYVRAGCPATRVVRSYMHFFAPYLGLNGHGLEYYGYFGYSIDVGGTGLGPIDIEQFDYVTTIGKELWGTYDVRPPDNNSLLVDCPAFGLADFSTGGITQSKCWPNAYQWALNNAGDYSARWGLNWKGAIDAFNWGTIEGKQEALFRLGHVLHMLEDVSVPEHSQLMAHPGGGFNGTELRDAFQELKDELNPILEKIKNKKKLCLELVPTANNAIQALGDIVDSLDPAARGYERFVSDLWDISRFEQIQGEPHKIPSGLPGNPSPDLGSYFLEIARMGNGPVLDGDPDWLAGPSQAPPYGWPIAGLIPLEEGTGPLKFHLEGCDSDVTLWLYLMIFPVIPSLDTEPYVTISDKLVEEDVKWVAGLMETFYDIVNKPPYVKKIEISQGGQLKYIAKWVDKYETYVDVDTGLPAEYKYGTYLLSKKVVSRELSTSNQGSLTLGQPAKLKVIFEEGPVKQYITGVLAGTTVPVVEIMDMGDSIVEVKGNFYADPQISMENQEDIGEPNVGHAWEGTFTPTDCSFTLGVTAQTTRNSYSGRNLFVKALDSNPQTPALVETDYPYNWQKYEPGSYLHNVNLGNCAPSIASITVMADKASYKTAETIQVTGTVPTPLTGAPVMIEVLNPQNQRYRIEQTVANTDGTYSWTFQIGGPLGISGTYTTKATYSGQSAETRFDLGVTTSPELPINLSISTDKTAYTQGMPVAVSVKANFLASGSVTMVGPTGSIPKVAFKFNIKTIIGGVHTETLNLPNDGPAGKYTLNAITSDGKYKVSTTFQVCKADDKKCLLGKPAKIIPSEAGSSLFEVEAENRSFNVAVIGEGITSLAFNKEGRSIALENDGSAGTMEIEVPKELLTGDFTVLVDDKEIPFKLSESETSSVLLLQKPAGSEVITIQGTIIPELVYPKLDSEQEFPYALVGIFGGVGVGIFFAIYAALGRKERGAKEAHLDG